MVATNIKANGAYINPQTPFCKPCGSQFLVKIVHPVYSPYVRRQRHDSYLDELPGVCVHSKDISKPELTHESTWGVFVLELFAQRTSKPLVLRRVTVSFDAITF